MAFIFIADAGRNSSLYKVVDILTVTIDMQWNKVTISNAQPIAPINVYIRLCLQQDQTTTDHHCWREYQDQNLLKMLLIFFLVKYSVMR